MWAAIITAAVTLTAWGIKEWKKQAIGNSQCGSRPLFKGESWTSWQNCTDSFQKNKLEEIEKKKDQIISNNKKNKRYIKYAVIGVSVLILGIIIFKKIK